ncbi:short transient receptor potential channel 4-like [Branchiostoma floridae]|uniref:Short transient receptor potential channel 4-like n=1 Tax=Branchiostoma floridae TaxID=7739 RepID=A0A9J7LXP6_BRAFL|nr:short transient receptor potential channel 4-like [Branchiostoma floridae]
MEENINHLNDKSGEDPRAAQLTLAEKQLLSAAASGDTASVTGLLTNGEGNVNVNCRDVLGRSAVELAVDAGNLETAKVLLQYGAKPGEALMYAVDKEDMAAVQELLKYSTQKDGSPSAAFPSEVTPIVLASHKNSLPLIKVLVDQGRFIPDPGVVLSKDDHAHQNLYRGLVSPYYILLTNDDPLSRAFELSSRLDDVGASKPEVEEVYAEMAEGSRSLSVDLLDQVWNRDEAAAILNCGDEVSPLVHGDGCQMKLSRLDMAVDHEQKRFVAHQWSQRLVNECWYGAGKYFTPTTNMAEYLRGFVLMLLTPILALIYLLAPMSVPGRFIRTPAVRFAMYLASVITFIVIILLRAENVGFDGPEGGQLAPEGTVLEWLIFVWILGMLLEEGRLMVKNGPLASLTAMGIMTWVIIVIYLAAFFLRIASHVEHGGPKSLYRFYWATYDTTLIAEALTAVGGVLAILRLLPLLTFDRFLGPLALSMSHMVKDIVKFLIIFFIVSIAFSAGLNEIYSFYSDVVDNICFTQLENATSPLKKTTCETSNAFGDFESSFEELFWSLFGLGSKDTLNLEVNPKAVSPGDPPLQEHTLTMYVGQALYGLYLVVAVVVLLNMLIAMMSNSYQHIADNETTEWRFEVTKLMLRYIRDDTTLPVPFNIIPTPKFIYNKVIKKCCLRQRYKREMDNKLQAQAENNRRYKEVLARLVRRYLLLHEREKGVEPIFADFTPHDPVTMATTTYL